jgi:NADPH-dependent ferric siderophore reductase
MTSIRQALHLLLADPEEKPFHAQANVVKREKVSANFTRITLRSTEFGQYSAPWPADAVKLELTPDEHRVYTVRHFDGSAGAIAIDVFDHGVGLGTTWAGNGVGITGRRPEFFRSAEVDSFLFLADSSALPAIAAIFDSLEDSDQVTAVLAVAPEDRSLVAIRPSWDVRWVDELPSRPPIPAGRVQAWVAGEASSTKKLRGVLLRDGAIRLDDFKVGAYWWEGRTWTDSFSASVEKFHRLAAEGKDMTDPTVLESLTMD